MTDNCDSHLNFQYGTEPTLEHIPIFHEQEAQFDGGQVSFPSGPQQSPPQSLQQLIPPATTVNQASFSTSQIFLNDDIQPKVPLRENPRYLAFVEKLVEHCFGSNAENAFFSASSSSSGEMGGLVDASQACYRQNEGDSGAGIAPHADIKARMGSQTIYVPSASSPHQQLQQPVQPLAQNYDTLNVQSCQSSASFSVPAFTSASNPGAGTASHVDVDTLIDSVRVPSLMQQQQQPIQPLAPNYNLLNFQGSSINRVQPGYNDNLYSNPCQSPTDLGISAFAPGPGACTQGETAHSHSHSTMTSSNGCGSFVLSPPSALIGPSLQAAIGGAVSKLPPQPFAAPLAVPSMVYPPFVFPTPLPQFTSTQTQFQVPAQAPVPVPVADPSVSASSSTSPPSSTPLSPSHPQRQGHSFHPYGARPPRRRIYKDIMSPMTIPCQLQKLSGEVCGVPLLDSRSFVLSHVKEHYDLGETPHNVKDCPYGVTVNGDRCGKGHHCKDSGSSSSSGSGEGENEGPGSIHQSIGRHIYELHFYIRRIHCPGCEETYSRKDSMMRHARNEHPELFEDNKLLVKI